MNDFCCDTPYSSEGSLTATTCEDGTEGGLDYCDEPPGEYGPADYTNYMDYAAAGCWNHFTPQQARRMHCWACAQVPGWIDSPDCNNNDVPDVCEITRGTDRDCDGDNVLDQACEAVGAAGACCLSNQPTDCIRTPTSACCSAAGGLNWYGLGSKCSEIDCSEGPMGPQGP